MKIKTADLVYGIPFLTGLALQILAVELFRQTFISSRITIGIFFLSGLIGFYLLRRYIQGTFQNKLLDLTISFIYCLVAIGGVVTYLFLAVNYHLANGHTTRHHFRILETGTLGKGPASDCFQPFAIIEKNGLTKEIILDCDLPKDITVYKSIALTVSDGRLGFGIIKNKELLD
jgi:hypothetical protein